MEKIINTIIRRNKPLVEDKKNIVSRETFSNKDKSIGIKFEKFQFDTNDFLIGFEKIQGIRNHFVYIVNIKSKIDNLEISINDFKMKVGIPLFEDVDQFKNIKRLQNEKLNVNEELKCYIVFARIAEKGCLNPIIKFKNYSFKPQLKVGV